MEAVKIGQQLIDADILHHVTDDHNFENENLFYRFRMDEDESNKGPSVKHVLNTFKVQKVGWVKRHGTMLAYKRYAVLTVNPKRLYLFKNEMDSFPKSVIDLDKCYLRVSETGECKTEGFSFSLTETAGQKKVHVIGTRTFTDHKDWLKVIAKLDVKTKEEEESVKISGKCVFDFIVEDVHNKFVPLSKYQGKFLIIVNVASR
eukprot:TRINITY_DN7497_c0_g1_i2.p1 TRINITY_DN7497_c0_g1~~TRINITY_DN7497_c0_g1_i2.p1  ORF type:complete len:238 (-),score=34.58 TRINITY_DN7497_c0_g1_i2:285-893(-)